MKLAGRIAVVTGGGQGVGAGIAERLASDGAFVAVNDMHAERAAATVARIGDSGGNAASAPFDVSELENVRVGMAKIERDCGPIDILVNNAGVAEGGELGPFSESDPSTWHRWIDLNLYGSMFCMREVLPGMCERGWGRVIQISSGSGSRGLMAGASVYGASKAGIEGLLRHVALEVGRNSVTVNAVALGFMEPPGASGDMVRQMATTNPRGRLGRPRDAAGAVAWLASDDAEYVTGQTIHVNGGGFQGR